MTKIIIGKRNRKEAEEDAKAAKETTVSAVIEKPSVKKPSAEAVGTKVKSEKGQEVEGEVMTSSEEE